MKRHRHSWETATEDGMLRFFHRSPRTLRIIQHPGAWVLSRWTLTLQNRFGAWEVVGSGSTLHEALELANEYEAKEHNPYGICNGFWHMESHGCHSACPQCGNKGYDQDLKDSYRTPFHEGPRVQQTLLLDGGPAE